MISSWPTPRSAEGGGRRHCSRRWRPRMPDSPTVPTRVFRARGAPAPRSPWPRPLHLFASVAELIAGATEGTGRAEMPGKSGARLEWLTIGGQPYVLKHLDLAEDWTMRASGCLRGAPLLAWERGILARLPACINQPIVGVAPEAGDGQRPAGGCALLMRDVSRWLVPVTDEASGP